MVSNARAKITPKAAKKKAAKKTASKPTPPKVDVKVDAPVTVDTRWLEQALSAWSTQLNEAFQEISKGMTELAENQEKLLKAIADSKPIVNIPPRPRGFEVELIDADGSSKRMRVVSNTNTH